MTISRDDILKLSVPERLELIDTIWDSLDDASDEIPLTEAQKLEIDRRLARYQRGETQLYAWDEVRARLEGGE